MLFEDNKKRKTRKKREKRLILSGFEKLPPRPERAWKETQIYYLPLMPSEQDEKDVGIKKKLYKRYYYMYNHR